jgi:hypothetical protein
MIDLDKCTSRHWSNGFNDTAKKLSRQAEGDRLSALPLGPEWGMCGGSAALC